MRKKIMLVLVMGLVLTGCGDVVEETKEALAEAAEEETAAVTPDVYKYEKTAIDGNNHKYTKHYELTLGKDQNATYVITDEYSANYFITTTYIGKYEMDDEKITFTFDDPQDGLASAEFVYDLQNGHVTETAGASEDVGETVELTSDKNSTVTISDVKKVEKKEEYIPYEPNFEAYGDYGRLEFQVNDDGTAQTHFTLDQKEVIFTGTYTVDGKSQRVCAFALKSKDGKTCNMDIRYDSSDYKYYYSGEIK